MKTPDWLLRLFLGALAIVLTSGMAWTQLNRGSVRGTITDQQGAVVPGAVITVSNAATGVQESSHTDRAGFYFIPDLVPGLYRIHIVASGFSTVDFNNVQVRAGGVSTVDAQLKVGSEVQTVSVRATNPLVQTDASNMTTSVSQHLVANLPMVGRDIQGLIALMPGMTQAAGPPGSLAGFNSQFSGFPDPDHIVGSAVSANGSQPSADVWYLDGNLNTAQGLDNAVVNPAPDAVAEFQAITSNYAPEYGRTAGAIFSVVLKSGTNQVHGSLYEYNRNSYFAALNPFAARTFNGGPAPQNYINWNQFGGTFGGPVVLPKIYNGKDRTFFFVAVDRSDLAARAQNIGTVPTMLERNGDFSEFPSVVNYGLYNPLTTTYNAQAGVFQRQPFLNANGTFATTLPASLIDPVAAKYLQEFPAPNFLYGPQQNAAAGGCLNTCDNYLSSYGSGQFTTNVEIKVDQNINEKNKFFAEFLWNPTTYSLTRLPWSGPTAPLTGFNGAFPWVVTNVLPAIGLTTTFSPTLINEFRYSYSRQGDVPQPLAPSLVGTQTALQQIKGLNIPVAPPLQPTPTILVGGLAPFGGGGFNDLTQVTEAHTFLDNVTKVYSRHNIKTGAMFRLDQTGTEIPPITQLIFGGGLVNNPLTGAGGNPVAQFLLGAVDQSSNDRVFFPTFSSTREWDAYIQDDWRVTSKLSLNYGLRWDWWGWPSDRFGNSSYFDFTKPNSVIPGLKGQIIYLNPGEAMFPSHWTDFAPRFNFAYALTPKTVIRGGWDLVYNDALTQVFGQGEGPSEAPGYNPYSTWADFDATGQNLINTNQVPAFILSRGAPPLQPFINPKAANLQVNIGSPGAGFLTQIPDAHDPYNEMWNFTVQRELPGAMALTVAYVGNEGHYLTGQNNRSYDYVSVANVLKYRNQLNFLVPTPALYQQEWGPQVFMSQLLKPYPQYANVQNFLSNDLNSNYQGLQVNLTKRFSHGLDFSSSFAWQKVISSPGAGAFLSNTWTGGPSFGSGRGAVGQLTGWVGNGAVSPQNPDDRNADVSVAPFDVGKSFNFAWTYELPTASVTRNKGRIVNAVIGGWEFSGTFTASEGLPEQIVGPCNDLQNILAPMVASDCLVNLVGSPSAGRGSKNEYGREQQWYNPNAFEAAFGSNPQIIQLATTGTPAQRAQYNQFYSFGTAGFLLDNALAPGFWGTDMSLFKQFKINESASLEFRFDVFNALNHQNLGLPNTNWCLPPNADGSTDAVHQFGCQFGRISNVQTDPRALQFGLHFHF